jgi:hypothetical protein
MVDMHPSQAKRQRSRLIRRLGGRPSLPTDADVIIDDALSSAAFCGACQERDRILAIVRQSVNATIEQAIIDESITDVIAKRGYGT